MISIACPRRFPRDVSILIEGIGRKKSELCAFLSSPRNGVLSGTIHIATSTARGGRKLLNRGGRTVDKLVFCRRGFAACHASGFVCAGAVYVRMGFLYTLSCCFFLLELL